MNMTRGSALLNGQHHIWRKRPLTWGALLTLGIHVYVLVTTPTPMESISRRTQIAPTLSSGALTQMVTRISTQLGNNHLKIATDISYQAMVSYDIMEINNALLGHDYDRAWE
eukprot:9203693-Ditylum_brightwellii.AAC.1